MEERELKIDILDFLRRLMKKWLVVLLAALLCSAAAGGYKWMKESRGYHAVEAVMQEHSEVEDFTYDAAQAAKELKDSDFAAVGKALEQNRQIDESIEEILDGELTADTAAAVSMLREAQNAELRKLTTDQRSLYDVLTAARSVRENGTEEEYAELFEVPKAGLSKKMIVIGFVAGAVLVCGIYFVLYVLTGKMRIADDLTDGFGIPVIGFAGDEAVSRELAAVAAKRNFRRILLTGVKTAEADAVRSSLAESLKKSGVEAICACEGDKEYIDALSSADTIIPVEQIDSTRYDDLNRFCERAVRLGADVLGGIVVR